METGKSDVLDKIEKINKKDSALQEIIPKGYEIEHHQCGVALYQLIPSKKEGEPDKKVFITNTIPQITERFEDIESNEVSFNMLFYDNKTPVNIAVSAEEISDSRQLLKLVNKKLKGEHKHTTDRKGHVIGMLEWALDYIVGNIEVEVL
ncbi:hypothetical protein [Staphylococcus aureus]|uniref:hypothetical protein n=1 Tax=Staphylococcus aureus TaxID=1280 RepID=UPI0034A0D151